MNNNNKDTIKVKYLTLTRLKAEYSNLLLIISGYAALNQQLHGEHAQDLMCKYQGNSGEKVRERQGRGRDLISRLPASPRVRAAVPRITAHLDTLETLGPKQF